MEVPDSLLNRNIISRGRGGRASVDPPSTKNSHLLRRTPKPESARSRSRRSVIFINSAKDAEVFDQMEFTGGVIVLPNKTTIEVIEKHQSIHDEHSGIGSEAGFSGYSGPLGSETTTTTPSSKASHVAVKGKGAKDALRKPSFPSGSSSSSRSALFAGSRTSPIGASSSSTTNNSSFYREISTGRSQCKSLETTSSLAVNVGGYRQRKDPSPDVSYQHQKSLSIRSRSESRGANSDDGSRRMGGGIDNSWSFHSRSESRGPHSEASRHLGGAGTKSLSIRSRSESRGAGSDASFHKGGVTKSSSIRSKSDSRGAYSDAGYYMGGVTMTTSGGKSLGAKSSIYTADAPGSQAGKHRFDLRRSRDASERRIVEEEVVEAPRQPGYRKLQQEPPAEEEREPPPMLRPISGQQGQPSHSVKYPSADEHQQQVEQKRTQPDQEYRQKPGNHFTRGTSAASNAGVVKSRSDPFVAARNQDLHLDRSRHTTKLPDDERPYQDKSSIIAADTHIEARDDEEDAEEERHPYDEVGNHLILSNTHGKVLIQGKKIRSQPPPELPLATTLPLARKTAQRTAEVKSNLEAALRSPRPAPKYAQKQFQQRNGHGQHLSEDASRWIGDVQPQCPQSPTRRDRSSYSCHAYHDERDADPSRVPTPPMSPTSSKRNQHPLIFASSTLTTTITRTPPTTPRRARSPGQPDREGPPLSVWSPLSPLSPVSNSSGPNSTKPYQQSPATGTNSKSTTSTKQTTRQHTSRSRRDKGPLGMVENDNAFQVFANLVIDFLKPRLHGSRLVLKPPQDRLRLERFLPTKPIQLEFVDAVRHRLRRIKTWDPDRQTPLERLTFRCQEFGLDSGGRLNPVLVAASLKGVEPFIIPVLMASSSAPTNLTSLEREKLQLPAMY